MGSLLLNQILDILNEQIYPEITQVKVKKVGFSITCFYLSISIRLFLYLTNI